MLAGTVLRGYNKTVNEKWHITVYNRIIIIVQFIIRV